MSREKTKEHLCNQIRSLAIAIYIGCITLLIDMKYGTFINDNIYLWFKYIIGIHILSNLVIPFIKIIFPSYYTIGGGIKALIISMPVSFLIVKGIYPKWLKTQSK